MFHSATGTSLGETLTLSLTSTILTHQPELLSEQSKIPNRESDPAMKDDQKADESLGDYVNEMLTFKSRPKRPRNRRVDLRRKEMQHNDYSAS